MILITGASGNVGREVVKQALAVGLKIRATFHSPTVAAEAPAGLECDHGLRQIGNDSSRIAGGGKDFSGWTAGSGTASIGSEFRQGGAREWAEAM